jgi:hypothetical protein
MQDAQNTESRNVVNVRKNNEGVRSSIQSGSMPEDAELVRLSGQLGGETSIESLPCSQSSLTAGEDPSIRYARGGGMWFRGPRTSKLAVATGDQLI